MKGTIPKPPLHEPLSMQHCGAARKGPWRVSRMAVAVASVLSAQAQAQPADKTIEEVVVTGTKRELNVQDVPQSITAFSQDAIARMAMKGMDDYMKALPSASLTNSMPGRNAISMRGISTGSSEYRTDSQVSVYLDEQPVTSISQHLEIHAVDIERIEALPGPQGTLFGSSSQSGTLRIITNRPNHDGVSAQIDAEASATKGGDPGYDLNGHVNIPVSDTLALRIVGYTSKEGGYVDNVRSRTFAGAGAYGSPGDNFAIADNDQNKYDYSGARLRAIWDMTENWSLDLAYQVEGSDANGAWESDPYLGDYKVARFFDEYRKDDWWQTSATVRGDLGFAQLVSTSSYFDRESSYEWDNMAYNQWQTSYYALYNGKDRYNFEYEFGTIFNEQTQKRFTQEVRLTSQGESTLDWMVGAFYEDVHDAWDYGAQIPNFQKTQAWQTVNEYACYYAAAGYEVDCPLAPTNKIYDQRYDNTVKQTAAFGELSWHITPDWQVTGGARWFKFERDREQIYTTPEGKPPVGSFGEGEGRYSSEGSDSAQVFKFGTQYQIDEDRMVYALYSEGFRLGGDNSPRAAASGQVPASYDPDTMQNYEAGLKSEWLDNSLQLNISFFLMKWDDIQFNRRADQAWWLRGTFNGEGGESRGVEVNWNWRITENLQFDGSGFLAKAEYTADTFDLRGNLILKDGQKMPNGPEEKLRFGLEYTVPEPFGMGGDLRFRYDTTYTGEIWDNIDDSFDGNIEGQIPETWHSNLQLGYDSGKEWEVTLVARNVWDNQGITNIVRGGAGDYADWFGDPRFHNERSIYRPRTISLGLKVKL